MKTKTDEVVEEVERVLRETGIRQRVDEEKFTQVLGLVRVSVWALEDRWARDQMACDRDDVRNVCDDLIDIVDKARRYGEDSVDPGAFKDRDEVIDELAEHLRKSGMRHWSEPKPEVTT